MSSGEAQVTPSSEFTFTTVKRAQACLSTSPDFSRCKLFLVKIHLVFLCQTSIDGQPLNIGFLCGKIQVKVARRTCEFALLGNLHASDIPLSHSPHKIPQEYDVVTLAKMNVNPNIPVKILYFIPKKEDPKAWRGPVFANDKRMGWKKLNAVRACTRCRVRHVRCSLIDSGGPCNHCRKRKETCEVLGWEMKPQAPPKYIYHYVLPPPRCPQTTPTEPEFSSNFFNMMVHPLELIERLEKLNPRAQAQNWPWGLEDKDTYYPQGSHFGDDYHEQCSAECPRRSRVIQDEITHPNTTQLYRSIPPRSSSPYTFAVPSVSPSISPSSSHGFSMTCSSISCLSIESLHNDHKLHTWKTSETKFQNMQQDIRPLEAHRRRNERKTNRMSLDYIMCSEPQYIKLPKIMQNISEDCKIPIHRPSLPSLREVIGDFS
ncbi:hypothetical protein CROQUDRAFT_713502 [Cronartium quercuum f. sp. fusiforme G11]|uniref:Zn(2)-C6 fungal-type domain-containing protein n=1 Tax=Cronartium quercuum f. sp. fusiforme G11 TaxID=708437 RepID=A0A9P6TF23_9BASI|nr:hypothetical protein CROQUDRAFT_713502 [Cronartium quercuum f. sp. fusiforme G11]